MAWKKRSPTRWPANFRTERLKMSDTLATIATFNSDHEAELARGILQSEGIEAFVFKDDCGGMLPQMQIIRGVHLKVNRQDEKRAREILDSD